MHKWSKEEVDEYRKEHGFLIYFNPDDSNFFVPKPFGIGHSINLGNPYAIIIIVLLITFMFLKNIGIF